MFKEEIILDKRMAEVCNEVRSSHVLFLMQQAYPELDIGWEDCEKLLGRILGIDQST